MANPKHTPGPWRAQRIEPSDLAVLAGTVEPAFRIHQQDAPELLVAEVWQDEEVPDEECAANAALIAKAPELAATLRDLVAALLMPPRSVCHQQGISLPHALDAAQAVLMQLEAVV